MQVQQIVQNHVESSALVSMSTVILEIVDVPRTLVFVLNVCRMHVDVTVSAMPLAKFAIIVTNDAVEIYYFRSEMYVTLVNQKFVQQLSTIDVPSRLVKRVVILISLSFCLFNSEDSLR